MDTDANIAEILVELADTLVDDYDLIDFMQRLAERVVQLLDISAAGLLLADPGNRLALVAWTSDEARRLELFELSADQGPCLDSFQTGRQLVNISCADSLVIWPEFGGEMQRAGYELVHALPMRLRGEVIGSLNLFQTTARKLDPLQVRVGQALADIATIELIQQRALAAADQLTVQLQTALDSRVFIEQAKGALAQHAGVDVDTAFRMMPGYARAHRVQLSRVAQAVLLGDFTLSTTNNVPAIATAQLHS